MITKRLHVSGLTPTITPADLSARFSNFGLVKSLDGFGLLDSVGHPRKFAYVTVEATEAALKKCVSTLSGTTYKGAKLRIGDAKPDYAERISKENSDAEPVQKKRRLHHGKFSGIQAVDMSVVTRENASQRPGWTVMPSGRIIKAMQMRPGKPLPPLPSSLKDTKKLGKKKKSKDPDVRARRRTIDVTRWDGSYITGVFLGEADVENMVESRRSIPVEPSPPKKKESTKAKVPPPPPQLSSAPVPAPTSSVPPSSTDLSHERDQTLSFLQSFLFSSSSKRAPSPIDWDSDVDIDEANVVEAQNLHESGSEYEIVPREEDPDRMDVDVDSEAVHDDEASEDEEAGSANGDVQMQNIPKTTSLGPQSRPPPQNSLKDLFAPREDEGGFSLSNHLNLDLDDDLDFDMVPFPTITPTPASTAIAGQRQFQTTSLPVPPISTNNHSQSSKIQTVALDSKKPFFFPRRKRQVQD
ncbi:hypothetical protein D9757_004758 [Collybiopsis confluens]|uniref:RRM domain-containing protein n=1 Tax=Collybiopsis confluens TaxID=2823264 RepID=A0A8H5MCC2_9AGAR|nr:hypothetical protein D9757_004758 [Collybiopsis confluens]